MTTEEAHQQICQKAQDIFRQKHQDYGPSWRVMRFPSLLDQLLIKCRRVRNIEDHQEQAVGDSIESEFYGMINYSIMVLIQRKLGPDSAQYQDEASLLELHVHFAGQARELMRQKNHDYGEVWREMMPTSFTDLILAKLYRMRQMVTVGEQNQTSEGINANVYDVMNYAVFALIQREKS